MSLAFKLSSHTIQPTHNKTDLDAKKKAKNKKNHPGTMIHFRARRRQEKAA